MGPVPVTRAETLITKVLGRDGVSTPFLKALLSYAKGGRREIALLCCCIGNPDEIHLETRIVQNESDDTIHGCDLNYSKLPETP